MAQSECCPFVHRMCSINTLPYCMEMKIIACHLFCASIQLCETC